MSAKRKTHRAKKRKNEKKRIRNHGAMTAAAMHRGELLACYVNADAYVDSPRRRPGPQGGRPEVYADDFIQALLMVKVISRLPLRALVGFARGIAQLIDRPWQIPDYTTICRRQARLCVELEA